MAANCASGLEVLYDLRRYHVRVVQASAVLQRRVAQPEDVQADLVARRLLVEEQHIRLDALGVEDAGRQSQQGVDVALVQQLATDRFAGTAFEQHIVRHHHRRFAVDRQDGLDVLHEVELLVRGRYPEVIADDRLRLAPRLTLVVDERHAALLAERSSAGRIVAARLAK